MDPVPLLVVQSCESISDKHALKSIRKFLDANSNSLSTLSISHRERISLVPDDVIAKLNVMSTVISEDLQRLKPDTTEKEKKSKKRRRSSSIPDNSELQNEMSTDTKKDKKKKKKTKIET